MRPLQSRNLRLDHSPDLWHGRYDLTMTTMTSEHNYKHNSNGVSQQTTMHGRKICIFELTYLIPGTSSATGFAGNPNEMGVAPLCVKEILEREIDAAATGVVGCTVGCEVGFDDGVELGFAVGDMVGERLGDCVLGLCVLGF